MFECQLGYTTAMALTELHRHLDASFRASTLATLLSTTETKIKNEFWLTRQMGSLQEVLDRFVTFQKALQSEEAFERLGYEALEDAAAEGISQIEFRYSPSFASELCQIAWDKVLAAFEKGLARAAQKTGVRWGLICIVSRDYGEKMAHRTIDFAVEHKKSFVGVDLAGNEVAYPPSLFTKAFRKATNAGLNVTIHAGEAAGPENIWDAIDKLGATRIGHGIAAAQDKKLLARMAKDKILIETAPNSNFITRSIETLADHPLPIFLSAGVPVSISTDDPGIFGITLGEEIARAKKALNLSDSDLGKIQAFAKTHSFIE